MTEPFMDTVDILDHIDNRIISTSGYNNDTRDYPPTVYRRAANEVLEAENRKAQRSQK